MKCTKTTSLCLATLAALAISATHAQAQSDDPIDLNAPPERSEARAGVLDLVGFEASLRIGLRYDNESNIPADIALQDYGSRLILQHNANEENAGIGSLGYIEVGIPTDNNDATSSFGTRQAYIGYRTSRATLTVGRQYGAFYDLIESHAEVSELKTCDYDSDGGCQFRDSTAKIMGTTGELDYGISITARADDVDNDLADNFEVGALLPTGNMQVGGALEVQSDEGIVDGGLQLGLMAQTQVQQGVTAAGILYYQNDDYRSDQPVDDGLNGPAFLVNGDDVFGLALVADTSDYYGRFSFADAGSANPYGLLVGARRDLDSNSRGFVELELSNQDTPAADTETEIRAVYAFDFR